MHFARRRSTGRRNRRWRTGVHQPHLASEALAGITQRPGRSAMTMLGTTLGVGAFVAVLGLTTTASAQIAGQFNALIATTVTVNDVAAQQAANEGASSAPVNFPPDADQRIDRLNGVVAAGVWWQVTFPGVPVISAAPGTLAGSDADVGSTTPVYAASPGLFRAMGATLSAGVFFNSFHNSTAQPVCVLGPALARLLGIASLDAEPAVFIDGQPFTVVGIMGSDPEMPTMLLGMIIPEGTALRLFGSPASSAAAAMLIRTRLGAAQLIARQAPLALDPRNPGQLAAVPPPNPRALGQAVNTDLADLFYLLAGICLAIGGVSIANTTGAAILERISEIGLRRSLGALRRHIAIQFLAESTALGLLGGLLGTAVAVAAVVSVAVARRWTAVLDPITVLPAPFAGAAIGFLAGVYPALRAALIEPLEALRR
jgi:putative ABC transport system permease protein